MLLNIGKDIYKGYNMKRIFINDNFLKQEDIEFEVIRVKALIVNSKNELLLAHNNNTYQLIGGHKEDDETLEDTLLREIKEETGIGLHEIGGPFIEIITYDNNYFDTGKKVCSKIYYYRVLTDEMPNILETHYDELESETDFNLFYVNVNEMRDFLHRSMDEGSIAIDIGREMLLVDREYHKLFD